MQSDEVYPYWEGLRKKRGQLLVKRLFDLFASVILLILLSIPMAIIALLIKKEDFGPVFYRQERITSYGKRFYIHKFRTMCVNADKKGTAVTMKDDLRVTVIGNKLRRFKLDELPQLFDVIVGDMSFVGTRPEIVKYVERYKPEYYATLLMPAGITSEASIKYKNEAELLSNADDVDCVYIEKVLQDKMRYNLNSLKKFSVADECLTLMKTFFAVFIS